MRIVETEQGPGILTAFGDVPVLILQNGKIYISPAILNYITRYLKLLTMMTRDQTLPEQIVNTVKSGLATIRTEEGTLTMLRLETLRFLKNIVLKYARMGKGETRLVAEMISDLLDKYMNGIKLLELPALMRLAKEIARRDYARLEEELLRLV